MTIEGENISERRDDQTIELLIHIHEATVSLNRHAQQIHGADEAR